MTQLSIVGVSGNTRRPSRTRALVGAIADGIAARLGSPARLIEVAADALPLLTIPARADAEGAGAELLEAIEGADVLVVGSPVYRVSYTGALKHVFDLVRHDALGGAPTVLAATGGSRMHGLVIEHQLRPLMGFFGALVVPTTVYAAEEDFAGLALASRDVAERVGRAADEAAALAGPARTRRGAREGAAAA